jgi:hypothetical protein
MLPLLWLALIAAGTLLAILFWDWIPGLVVGMICLSAVVWILVSTLSPAVPKRGCPKCGKEGLVKIQRGEPGVRCEHCDFRDENMHVAYLDEW